MKKTAQAFTLIIIFLSSVGGSFVKADEGIKKSLIADSCSNFTSFVSEPSSEFVFGENSTFDFTLVGLLDNTSYSIHASSTQYPDKRALLAATSVSDSHGRARFEINDPSFFPLAPGPARLNNLILEGPSGGSKNYCFLWEYQVIGDRSCDISSIQQIRGGSACFFSDLNDQDSCLDPSSKITVNVENIKQGREVFANKEVTVRISGARTDDTTKNTNADGSVSTEHEVPNVDEYTVSVYKGKGWGNDFIGEVFCKKDFRISLQCNGICQSTKPLPKPSGEDPYKIEDFKVCNQIPNPTLKAECVTCASEGEGGADEQAGVWTAIGCIKRDSTSIVQSLVKLGLGIGGGVSLIMTLAGGFLITTSQGDPKRADQAKEMITSAIVGLLIIIFSVTILQFIGFDILRIPGFGAS